MTETLIDKWCNDLGEEVEKDQATQLHRRLVDEEGNIIEEYIYRKTKKGKNSLEDLL